MNSFKRSVAAAIAVLILGSLVTLSVPIPSGAQENRPPQDVTVVNTPLPTTLEGTASVSGDVTVANTPGQPVPTTVQGTANISGAVTVANAAGQPVPVIGPSIEPFQLLRLANFTGNTSTTLAFGSPAAGKLLIVEQLSVSVSTDASPDVAAVVDLEVREGVALKALHRMALTRQDFTSNFAAFLANVRLRAFVNEHQTLQVRCAVTPAPTTMAVPGCVATAAGRFVSAP